MTPEERKSFRLAIVDTEFSDLDLSLCELLEVAILIVDLDLNEHARKSWIADNSILKSAKARMSPEVLEMHTKSGLLAEIEKHVWAPPSKVLDDRRNAAVEITEFLMAHTFGPKLTRMTGFSVHTDREVLRNQASEVKWDDFFHYRLCNVSTPREMARWWSPSAALAEVDKKENLPHRAMIDCERVVFELKHYKEKIFDAVTLADEHHRNFPKVSR
jgi:oligoribonuclease (3'-5' exoribonuclease)